MQYAIAREDTLAHHGIKGQKWGVRRYENADGTLTEAGKKRYSKAMKIASKEKIDKKQMAKNAIRRGLTGMSVGTAIGGIKAISDIQGSLNKNFEKKFTNIPDDLAYDINSGKIKMPGERIRTMGSFYVPGSKGYDVTSLKLPQMNITTSEGVVSIAKFTKDLMNSPSSNIGGGAIGLGVGTVGSITVDAIHNARIDKARKFVKDYKDAYEKTYGGANS